MSYRLILSITCAFVALLLGSFALPGAAQRQDARILELGRPIERELAGKQSHNYLIELAANDFLYIIVEQRGVDVVVTVHAPDGKQLMEVDSINGTQGPERVMLIGKTAGTYRLEVRSLDKGPAGQYNVKLTEKRAATSEDVAAIKAQDTVTGAFEGLVVDRATHAPIQGASVRILNDVARTEIALKTDYKGRFYQGLLPPGVYRVQFSSPGYLSREVPQRLHAKRYQEFIPLPVELDPDKPRENQIPKGGIAVASVPNALVQVESLEDESIFKRLIAADELLCVFDDLLPKNYRVSATLDGYQPAKKDVVVAANKTLAVTLKLSPSESSAQITAQAGRYYALIIGNNAYQSVPSLRTAESDAKALEQVLRERYGFETKLLLNAKREQIIVTLNEYRRKVEPNSNLLIYYAGHGYNDAEVEKAYWLPVDARKEDNANWISADDITVNVKGIPARHVIVVSDSCYSGTIARGVEFLLTRAMEPMGRDKYLLKMSNGKSRTLMASGGNEPVDDDGSGGHSVFANALLTGLMQMDRDIFSAEELYYSFIREVVTGKSNQTPEYNPIRNSGHESGDFVFIRKR
jgi:caspase domain-containing protein/carboxypeptidase family protein